MDSPAVSRRASSLRSIRSSPRALSLPDADPGAGPGRAQMVCQECGRIELLHDTRLDRMLRRVAQRVPMRSAVCELTVYGLCRRCSD